MFSLQSTSIRIVVADLPAVVAVVVVARLCGQFDKLFATRCGSSENHKKPESKATLDIPKLLYPGRYKFVPSPIVPGCI